MDDYTIVSIYGAEYRGIVQYYLLASDVYRLNRLNWVMETSMLKTLAGKHRSTVCKTAAKYKAKVDTPYGLRTCFEARIERTGGRKPLVARYGGIPLRPQKKAILRDHEPGLSGRSQGTDYQTPCEPMRDLRALGKRSSAPYPKARGPRQIPRQVLPDGYARYGRRSWRNGGARPL